MDDITRSHYEHKFEIAFLKAKGDAFQTLFEQVMGKAHPADFIPCRPWGNVGDRKNDGYLKSERTLFQVYAPNEMTAAVAIAKIDEDFTGALPHWRQHFDKWVFVHNAHDGLSPQIIAKLLELERQHSPLEVTQWSLEELRQRLRRIPLNGLQALFGFAPTDTAKRSLSVAELETVLNHIAQTHPPTGETPRPVPTGKIEANGLSRNVAALLKAGMEKAELVEKFFDRWHDALYGDRLAGAFRSRYIELRDQSPKIGPDEIFHELHTWAGGTWASSSGLQVAVLAVLAFFFEQCEIFEAPRAGTNS
jgi:hypothetical protein